MSAPYDPDPQFTPEVAAHLLAVCQYHKIDIGGPMPAMEPDVLRKAQEMYVMAFTAFSNGHQAPAIVSVLDAAQQGMAEVNQRRQQNQALTPPFEEPYQNVAPPAPPAPAPVAPPAPPQQAMAIPDVPQDVPAPAPAPVAQAVAVEEAAQQIASVDAVHAAQTPDEAMAALQAMMGTPAPVAAPVADDRDAKLVGLQPGETALPPQMLDFMKKLFADNGIDTDDALWIVQEVTGRRDWADLTPPLALKLQPAVLAEVARRAAGGGALDRNASLAPTAPAASAPKPAAYPAGPAVSYGPLLTQARNEIGWSLEEAATRIGVSGKALGGYENGETKPRSKTIDKIAEVYGLALDSLHGGTVNFVAKPVAQLIPTPPADILDAPAAPAAAPAANPFEATPVAAPAPTPEKTDFARPSGPLPQTATATGNFIANRHASAILAQVNDQIAQERLPIPAAPQQGDATPLPSNFTGLSDEQVRALSSEYHAWGSRVNYLLAIAETELYAAELIYEEHHSTVMRRLELDSSKDRSVTLMKAEALESPEVKEWRKNVQQCLAQVRSFKALRDFYFTTCERLSREWTMRTNERDAQNNRRSQ